MAFRSLTCRQTELCIRVPRAHRLIPSLLSSPRRGEDPDPHHALHISQRSAAARDQRHDERDLRTGFWTDVFHSQPPATVAQIESSVSDTSTLRRFKSPSVFTNRDPAASCSLGPPPTGSPPPAQPQPPFGEIYVWLFVVQLLSRFFTFHHLTLSDPLTHRRRKKGVSRWWKKCQIG